MNLISNPHLLTKMKFNIKHIAAFCTMAALGVTVNAQNTYSGYFLDNYNYQYEMNPAFGNDMHFVGMPALGNVNLAMRGSLHLTNVFHVVDGRTVLFTNPNVPATFLKDMPSASKLGADIKLNILSAGFKAFGGYNAISINARADVHAAIPKTFFELAKEGISNRRYDIRDLNVNANAYAEIVLNHSRDITQVPGLRVGASMKFLLGVANMDARFNEADLTLGQNEWIARTNADIYANLGGFRFKTKTNDKGQTYVDGADMNDGGSVGVNGFGMAFDLGGVYSWKDFDFSLGVTDLGWISYFDTQKATTNGTKLVNTDAYTFNADENADNSFENEWNRLSDDLSELYRLDNEGNVGTRNCGLGATLNIGVRYKLPYYRKLHFGFLSTTRIHGRYTWSEARISAGVQPVKCFSADVNMAFGTYGCAFGWMLNFNHKGFNIFLGMDNTLGKLAKQGIPLNSNASVNLGINFPF